ncbi:MAG: glycosyltransferase family 2 protein [archaeon]|nr:glycosyltransferase family 2 protein [Candidatus Micrarchaeota archaeon]
MKRTKSKPDASIIILNWNSYGYTKNCINSIKKNTPDINYEIILVDNGSKDGSCERLEKQFPDLIFIKNKVNKGFPYGLNQGYRVSRGNYLVPMNNDALVTKDWLNEAINLLESDEKIGIVGVKEVSPQQFEDKELIEKIRNSPNREKMTLPVGWVMKRKMLQEVGYLDTEYFSPVYGEEADWNFRARKLGYRIMECSKCIVIHFSSKDASKGLGNQKQFVLLNTHRLRSMLFNLSLGELIKFVPGLGLIAVNSIKEKRFMLLLKSYWNNLKDWRIILRERRKKRIYIPFKEPKFTPPFVMEDENNLSGDVG